MRQDPGGFDIVLLDIQMPGLDGSLGRTEKSMVCQSKQITFTYIADGARLNHMDPADLNILFIYNMPFRAIAKMTGGAVSSEMVDGLVLMVNGRFWKGLTRTVRGFFRNRAKNEAHVAMLSADWKEE